MADEILVIKFGRNRSSLPLAHSYSFGQFIHFSKPSGAKFCADSFLPPLSLPKLLMLRCPEMTAESSAGA